MNIRYYSIAKDAFEAGDCPTCARCGATMRHVTEVDGQLYGNGCGKIVIAAQEKVESEINALVAEAAKVLPAAAARFNRGELTADEIQNRIYSCYEKGRGDWAAAWERLYTARCKKQISPAFTAKAITRHTTDSTPTNVHKIGLIYASARAIVDRKVDTTDNSAVWDVIDEFGRSRVVGGVLISNPFYDRLDVMDWNASDDFKRRVLTVAKALAS